MPSSHLAARRNARELLLDSQCKGARPKAKQYRLRDGGGLFLLVLPDARKYWQLRYVYGGRERLLQLGAYPGLSLKQARIELAKRRAQLQGGKDPVIARRLERLQQVRETADSFGAIAREWLEHFRPSWSSAHHQRNEGILRRLLEPELGLHPIKQIDVTALLSVLRAAEAKGVLMSARRARTIAQQVFTYAIATGRATHNPARELLGAMAPKPLTKHQGALKLEEVGPMLLTLAGSKLSPVTTAALRVMLCTGLRDFALRGARWSEIDFKTALWTVPAERMKGRVGKRKAHAVPLPLQAIAELQQLSRLTHAGPDSFVFAARGKQGFLAENTLRLALHRLGFAHATAHGFRSLFCDWAYENGFPSEAIERQLAHADRSEVRAAYLRTDFIDERRFMMQQWADVCQSKLSDARRGSHIQRAA